MIFQPVLVDSVMPQCYSLDHQLSHLLIIFITSFNNKNYCVVFLTKIKKFLKN